MKDIQKRYGHVTALTGASLEIYPGAVNAIMGDNGAGKSTLIKVLSGTHQPDAGEIIFEGKSVSLTSPTDARALGIETVYQDLALCTTLDPAANVFLGREIKRKGVLGRWLGFLDDAEMKRQTDQRLSTLKIDLGPARKAVEYLSGGQRQAVAIARAIAWSEKVLILDEPTAALGVKETALVMELIRRVRDSGVAVILIMHNLPQVFEIADWVTVIRLGRDVGAFPIGSTNMGEVVGLMTGVTVANGAARS